MSRSLAAVYLVAFTLWLAGWAAVVTLSLRTENGTFTASGLSADVLFFGMFLAGLAIPAIGWLRVQRGEVARDSMGLVVPLVIEWCLLCVGVRVPAAIRNLR
ncbi:hypothetical protein [Geodermatophilus sp. URMC 63]